MKNTIHSKDTPSFRFDGGSIKRGTALVRDYAQDNTVVVAKADQAILGIANGDTEGGEMVGVQLRGYHLVILAEGVEAGDDLGVNADGHFIKATGTVVAIAEEAGAEGEKVEALLK